MTVYVFADSHRYKNRMLDRVLSDSPDRVIFLGDVLSDVEELVLMDIPVFSVCGNNDFSYSEETEKILFLNKNKVFITHGHRYGVKNGLSRLKQRGTEIGADIVLYAHTHLPFYEYVSGMHIMNPGSVRDSGTFGKMVFDGGRFHFSIERL